MIVARCPACANELNAPESFVGKKVRCKSEGCGQVFVVAAAPVVFESIAEPATPVPSFTDQRLEFESRPTTPAVTPVAVAADIRYPNLQKYLHWARILAKTQMVLLMTISCTVFLVSLIYPLSKSYSFQQGILVILAGAAFSVLIGVVAYLIFVFSMAAIEFVHVILDIEANTRSPQYCGSED